MINLKELNDRYEDYGMNINKNKTKTMVIGRKLKKIDMRIKDESVEQVDCFKYLRCNISCNLNYCQEVEQRIAIAKEAFNRKRSSFCGPLEKELSKRLVFCVECSVVWCRLGHYGRMSKDDWKHLEKDGACKMDRQNKECSCIRNSGRRKNNAGTDKEEEKTLAGPLAKKELPAEGCSRRNSKREECSRQEKISDDRQHYDK